MSASNISISIENTIRYLQYFLNLMQKEQKV